MRPGRTKAKREPSKSAQATGGTPPTIRWDDRNIKSSYANVCNVSSTREEVVLRFGTNQAWGGRQPELRVELSHRIILSPFAAKRLADLLTSVLLEYESRFGPLSVNSSQPGGDVRP